MEGMEIMNNINLGLKIGSIISKFIPTGIKVSILKGPLKGYYWIVGAAAGEAKGLSVILNLSEASQLDCAMQNTKKDSICFDIGANVGFYSLLFARYGKEVISFEPLSRNIYYLYKTININQIKNIKIIPCAISEFVDISWFEEGSNCATGKINSLGKLPVFTLSVDYFINKTNIVPNIIKIDVEGAEFCVLKGARKCIAENRPKILISIHGDELRTACIGFIKEFNYGINPIDSEDIHSALEYIFIPL